MTWNNTQPQPNQFISQGQGTILNDIQFLGNNAGNLLPGFINFPSGLIMQWGVTGTLTKIGTDTVIPLVFTVLGMQAFPNNCFAVFAQPRTNTVSDKFPVGISAATPVTKLGFSITVNNTWPSGCYIFAIGN